MYHHIGAQLRESYDRMAGERDASEPAPWKIEERQQFLARLQQEGKATLLAIRAGTGRDSLFFQDHGLDVMCTDLSPANFELLYFQRIPVERGRSDVHVQSMMLRRQ